MSLIYSLLFTMGAILAAPYFLWRMLTTGKGREGLKSRFWLPPGAVPQGVSDSRPLWLHAVSVGEAMAMVPLARAIRTSRPDLRIVVSTVTPTGRRAVRVHFPEADALIYLPLDFPWAVRRAVKIVNPRLFITFETELWPNLIRHLLGRGVPCGMANGRISASSFRGYRLAAPVFRKVISCFAFICMQTEEDLGRVLRLGASPDRAILAGNLKYVQAAMGARPGAREEALKVLGLKGGEKLLVAGSTHQGEEDLVLDAYQALKSDHPDLVLLIAPRHPERFQDVEQLCIRRGHKVMRRSQITGEHSESLILLDAIGELGTLYAAAWVIFVGGSLVPMGGHNVLEAAAHGVPVLFGPHMKNFAEAARRLIDGGGATQVRDVQELVSAANKFLGDPQLRTSAGAMAARSVKECQGALEAHMKAIAPFLG